MLFYNRLAWNVTVIRFHFLKKKSIPYNHDHHQTESYKLQNHHSDYYLLYFDFFFTFKVNSGGAIDDEILAIGFCR
jgi:hypothetical protein